MKKIQLFFTLFIASQFSFGQLTEVWDFGATQLDNTVYNNKLDVATINSWYAGTITPGTQATSNTMPTAFTVGALSWVGNTSDRLRTSNTSITRYDATLGTTAVGYNGRVYCNGTVTLSSGLPTNRYLKLTLNEDDEVTIYSRGDTDGSLKFIYESNPSLQSDAVLNSSSSSSVTEAKFVAKTAGVYRIYDATAKASFYRIMRKAAVYTAVSGSVDVTNASGIPNGYSLVFTNAAGKTWSTTPSSGNYSVNLPVGYTYTVSLANASGYIVNTGTTFSTVGAGSSKTNNVSLLGVTLYTVTGSITGLGSSISNLGLTYTPDPSSNSVYVPNPVINTANATYSVQLEANVPYTISAQGVNDYSLSPTSITATQASTSNLTFTAKTLYPVTLNISGLNTTQQTALQLTFTNINESGYAYTFSNPTSVSLRNGTYKISYAGLDSYPVEMALTSNLTVNGTSTTKNITFNPVTAWSFDDKTINSTTSVYYKGMQLNGQVASVTSSGHLTAKTGSTIVVPVNPGQKVIVNYYYTANFSIEGGATITTATNSTSILESTQYSYTGSVPGTVTITVGGASTLTTYFPEIRVVNDVAYASTLTVGQNRQYQTINAALAAVANMNRSSNQRVTLLIDPGNYEEMLVIDQPNITLKNASSTPSNALLNKGVDIDPNAVRITSYYGYGYNYYSMAANQKWNQEVLNVNKQNGSYSNLNAGGTTLGSYWNATVVVAASGFQAENIIFENSFNQYISNKESQDVLVPFTTGSPGVRPTTVGDNTVQNRNFRERAAAIAFTSGGDRAILNQCKVVGRQDAFFGSQGARVVVYKGDMLGGVDYIYGGMTAVFYKSNLVMNVTDSTSDLTYITAAQQTSGRGFLFYQCNVTSATPGVDNNSTYRANPGYFGRPWAANTSEVVFYNTTIETSNNPANNGLSLIVPAGWNNSLGGTSAGMYEYGSTENSGVNNTSSRASWATSLITPTLNDGTAITTFNFTKGIDSWDPIPTLEANGNLGTAITKPSSSVKVYTLKNQVFISNIKSLSEIKIYSMNGALYKSLKTYKDIFITLPNGIWFITISSAEGLFSNKVLTSN